MEFVFENKKNLKILLLENNKRKNIQEKDLVFQYIYCIKFPKDTTKNKEITKEQRLIIEKEISQFVL